MPSNWGWCLRGKPLVNHSCQSAAVVVRHAKASGYVALDWPEAGKALLDLAPVGPDYQPGHAHADTLSFELSLFGQRVFVNSGTSQYGVDDERDRQRCTAAHNTLEIDGKSSSEVWAGFRVREWWFYLGGLRIIDRVHGPFQNAVVRFHLHPQVKVEKGSSALILNLPGGQICRLEFEGAERIEIRDKTWHPGFGRIEANNCIEAWPHGDVIVTNLYWQLG
jgi:uncharacterized heparinase superfamily protein